MTGLSVEPLASLGDNLIFRQQFCLVRICGLDPAILFNVGPILVGQRIFFSFFKHSLEKASKDPLSQKPFRPRLA